MINLEIRATTTCGIIYIIDFQICYFYKITALLREYKIPFELTTGADSFRIEILEKNITLAGVITLIEKGATV